MSEKKPSQGFDAERMRSQFDKLLKSTMEGLEELKDVVVKASQSAKVKLDATFLRRERDRLYQLLGEEVFELIEQGNLKTPTVLRDTVDRVNAIVEQLATEEARLAGEEGADYWTGNSDAKPTSTKKKAAKRKKTTRKKTKKSS